MTKALHTASIPAAAPSAEGEPFVVASHEALFARSGDSRCDACGGPLPAGEGDSAYGLPGKGVYASARAGETKFDTAPLCPSCASAIGMTALARWEIEEDEG